MKLWLVSRTSEDGNGIYDCYHGFMIRARNEQQARHIASQHCADEGPSCWLTTASIKEVFKSGEAGVLLDDFHAG